jgi:hypothetical protein
VAKVQMQHPEGRKAPSIEESMYAPVRAAILDAVPRTGDGLPFRDLSAEVAARTPAEMWSRASLGWYTTVVKLDLEAREEIYRVPDVVPQRLLRR